MTTNSAITIYHKDSTKQDYTRIFCPRVWVHETCRIIAEKNGVEESGGTAVRIPLPYNFLRCIGTKSNALGATECGAEEAQGALPLAAALLSVTLGDYVFLGESEDEAPPKALCKRVVAVHGNYHGTQPHIKLMVR